MFRRKKKSIYEEKSDWDFMLKGYRTCAYFDYYEEIGLEGFTYCKWKALYSWRQKIKMKLLINVSNECDKKPCKNYIYDPIKHPS